MCNHATVPTWKIKVKVFRDKKEDRKLQKHINTNTVDPGEKPYEPEFVYVNSNPDSLIKPGDLRTNKVGN